MDPLLENMIALQMEGIVEPDDPVDMEKRFSLFNITRRVKNIFAWFLDLVSDILLIINFFIGANYAYAAVTIFLLLFSNFMAGSYLSITLNLMKFTEMSVFKPSRRIFRRFFLMLFGPGVRKAEALYFAIKCNRASQQKDKETYAQFSHKLKEADFECKMMLLVECFCEKAPQMLLSLHLLFNDSEYSRLRVEVMDDPTTILALFKMTCLMFWDVGYKVHHLSRHPIWPVAMLLKNSGQIAWTLFSHHKNVFCKKLEIAETKYSYFGHTIYLMWRVVEIASRIHILIVLLLFGPHYFLPAISLHAILCGCFLRYYKFQNYADLSMWGRGVRFIVITFRYLCCGVMSIFTFFIPFMLPTRIEYLVYYTFLFIENTLLIITALLLQIISWPTLLAQYVTFFAALALLVFYCSFIMKWNESTLMSKDEFYMYEGQMVEDHILFSTMYNSGSVAIGTILEDIKFKVDFVVVGFDYNFTKIRAIVGPVTVNDHKMRSRILQQVDNVQSFPEAVAKNLEKSTSALKRDLSDAQSRMSKAKGWSNFCFSNHEGIKRAQEMFNSSTSGQPELGYSSVIQGNLFSVKDSLDLARERIRQHSTWLENVFSKHDATKLFLKDLTAVTLNNSDPGHLTPIGKEHLNDSGKRIHDSPLTDPQIERAVVSFKATLFKVEEDVRQLLHSSLLFIDDVEHEINSRFPMKNETEL